METLNKHFRTIAGPVFARHGFAQAELLSRWREIVGVDMAAFCRPEKIRWPRGSEAKGGTLVVRAVAGRTLEVQQSVPVVLERIAQYLGHGAVNAVKVVNSAELPQASHAPAKSASPPARVVDAVEPITDPQLQAALLRLGAAVVAESTVSPPFSPQAKQASGTAK